jgi:nucleotide-binding universal stress UspA family protein
MAGEHLPWSAPPELAPLSTAGNIAKLAEIVVFVDGRTETGAILEFAGALAREHGAHLIGVFMQPQPARTQSEAFARGEGILAVIEAHRAQLERIEADHRSQFEDIVGRYRIRSEWRSGPALETAGPPGLAESLVMTSGRPIIMLPPGSAPSRIRRILVGWNSRREAIRAVADALPLLVRAEAVEVLVVDHERRPADHGQDPGADIARHLARHGAHIEVQRRSSGGEDVGHFLLSQAAAFGADLVVMGAYGHSHLSEWVFGSVTRTVLGEAALPVLMSR